MLPKVLPDSSGPPAENMRCKLCGTPLVRGLYETRRGLAEHGNVLCWRPSYRTASDFSSDGLTGPRTKRSCCESLASKYTGVTTRRALTLVG